MFIVMKLLQNVCEALRKRYWALWSVTEALRGVAERYGILQRALRDVMERHGSDLAVNYVTFGMTTKN